MIEAENCYTGLENNGCLRCYLLARFLTPILSDLGSQNDHLNERRWSFFFVSFSIFLSKLYFSTVLWNFGKFWKPNYQKTSKTHSKKEWAGGGSGSAGSICTIFSPKAAKSHQKTARGCLKVSQGPPRFRERPPKDAQELLERAPGDF